MNGVVFNNRFPTKYLWMCLLHYLFDLQELYVMFCLHCSMLFIHCIKVTVPSMRYFKWR